MVETRQEFFGKGKTKSAKMVIATSAIELLNWTVETHQNMNEYGGNGCASSELRNSPEDSWDYNAGWKGSCDLIRTGWHEGVEKMVQATEHIAAKEVEVQKGYRPDVVGQFFDVGAVNSGIPECWWEDDYQPVRRSVKINVVGSCACGINATRLTNRGGAIAALVDKLQQSGWIVSVSLLWPFQNHGSHGEEKNCISIVRIDLDAKPLDLDEIGYLLAHPAAFRRLGFAAAEALNDGTYLGNGYGGGSLKKNDRQLNALGFTDNQGQAYVDWALDGTDYTASVNLLEYLEKYNTQEFETEESSAIWLHKELERLNNTP